MGLQRDSTEVRWLRVARLDHALSQDCSFLSYRAVRDIMQAYKQTKPLSEVISANNVTVDRLSLKIPTAN